MNDGCRGCSWRSRWRGSRSVWVFRSERVSSWNRPILYSSGNEYVQHNPELFRFHHTSFCFTHTHTHTLLPLTNIWVHIHFPLLRYPIPPIHLLCVSLSFQSHTSWLWWFITKFFTVYLLKKKIVSSQWRRPEVVSTTGTVVYYESIKRELKTK